MARYIGPSTKIARKFGEPIFGAEKELSSGTAWCSQKACEEDYRVWYSAKRKTKGQIYVWCS